MSERVLYKSVGRFIEKRFDCFEIGYNRGKKYGKVDVIGLRDVVTDLHSDYEVICVEVKDDESFLKSIGQAYSYSIYGHRCYLAVDKPGEQRFSKWEKDIASKLGVGLIEIKGNGCNEVSSSPYYDPIKPLMLGLIERVGYAECVICRTLFESDESDKKLISAIENENSYVFWLWELNERRIDDKRESNYNRRYVCPDCIHSLSKPIA